MTAVPDVGLLTAADPWPVAIDTEEFFFLSGGI